MIKSLWRSSYIAVISMLLGLIPLMFFIHIKWDNELFHVLLEGGGSLISFVISLFISSHIIKKRMGENYIWAVVCFIVMGILDLAHSQVPPGQAFVWLHSCATLFGGVFASLILFPASISKKIFNKYFFLLIILISIVFSVGSMVFPELTLDMLDNRKNFTLSAKILNLIGGAGFIIAWGYFAKEYHFKQSQDSIYFSNHFLLFGLAAFLFQFSTLWDGSWWLWHILRALAFLVLMYHFASLYWKDIASLIHKNQQLIDAHKHLKQKTDEAIEANKAKSAFLANISHELRTPMHGILSFAHFGIKNIDKEDKAKNLKYFKRINSSGDRLLMLLDDLLDLSKLEAGKMTFELKEANLRDIVENCIAEQQVRLEDLNLKTTVEVIGSTRVVCDVNRIGQVFTNLLSNAIKFSVGQSAIRIEIKPALLTRPDDENVDCLKLCIANRGNEIPVNELETVFDKFFQSSKTKSDLGGTGLGLAICREIISRHNGKIWVENLEGYGPIFSFVIPVN